MILYFDTETTGLTPGRIIQLSYILDYGDRQVFKNFYFAVDYIEPSAQSVHGISIEKLKVLSNGKTFSEFEDEIYDDFYNADLVVSHNFNFDLNFMIAEFKYLDRVFRYHESLDTMRYFTPILKLPRKSGRGYKFPKLDELASFAEVFPYDVTKFVMKNFNKTSAFSHDARYDTAMMFLAVQCLKEKFLEFRNFIDSYLN